MSKRQKESFRQRQSDSLDRFEQVERSKTPTLITKFHFLCSVQSCIMMSNHFKRGILISKHLLFHKIYLQFLYYTMYLMKTKVHKLNVVNPIVFVSNISPNFYQFKMHSETYTFFLNIPKEFKWLQPKSLYKSCAGRLFYGTENEIWAGFRPVGSAEKKWGPILSNIWGWSFHVFRGKK